MAERLDAVLVLQRYSRLVIDCNRPHGAPDLAPAVSDTVAVPGNARRDPADLARRIAAIHTPFHDRVAAELDRRRGSRPILVAVHSFTPALAADRRARPWQIGLLARQDRFALALMERIRRHGPALVTAMNEPYRIADDGDWTIPVHGEARGLPHVLIEVRNDMIRDAAGQTAMAGLIARALSDTIEEAAWLAPT
jgi:predicted N-formylglutamate amidohydrolase